MKRWWVIPALAGVLAVTGLAYWGYNVRQDRDQLITYLNNRNQRAYYEMVDHVRNMEVMLSKGIVSNSPRQRMMVFADIWQTAYAAQSNLSEIPVGNPSMTRTLKFLTQTGDYTWSLAKKIAGGEAIKPEEIRKLNELHTEAGFLAAELQKLSAMANNGSLTWNELKNAVAGNLKDQKAPTLVGVEKLEKNMQEFPTLIYDGPFSDHILTRKPKGVTGDMIDANQARTIARNLAKAASGQNYRVARTEGVNGVIPAFRIHLVPQKANAPVVIADISKKGGHPLLMLSNRAVNRKTLTREKAVEIAAKYLSDRGYKNMEPTYVIEQQNTAVVLFQYKQGEVLVYPDLMKVKVAMDNGDVVGFEGTGFFMNHHSRKNIKPKISESKALKAVNPQLKIQAKRLAIIPLDNLKEVLAYEFRGDLNGDTFLVYINAITGEEERIMKVIDTDSGPISM